MSTYAPAPTPHRRLHLPSHRRLSQLGFVAGAAGGALSYLATPSVAISFLVFVLLWYCLGYAVPRVAEHEERRRDWTVHAALLPVVAVAAAVAVELAWPHHGEVGVVLALLVAVALQAGLTHLLLRGVVDDQQHDLRRRLGLE